jgi:histone deacetylase complex regulatory component SIN3
MNKYWSSQIWAQIDLGKHARMENRHQRAQREHRELAKQFVLKVKARFPYGDYKQFLEILHDYEDQKITITAVTSEISKLFRGHNDLLEEFGAFLPDNMKGKALERKEDTNEEAETDCGIMDSEVAPFLCSARKVRPIVYGLTRI